MKTFKATITMNGSGCLIPLPFDPKATFGKVRAPVKVTINKHTWRSTVALMRGPACLPFRRSHREAAGVSVGDSVVVRVELDTEKRTVTAPSDLLRALKAAGVADRWKSLSYTHQREHVEAIEEAKKPETRARRIAAAVTMLGR
jgi:hypothetical protein